MKNKNITYHELMSDICADGSGKMKLSALQPLLVTGITIATSDQKHSDVKGPICKFPRPDSKIVTGFVSEAYGKIKLYASVDITSIATTALINTQIITDAGFVLASSIVNPGTNQYILSADTYTQPGTAYLVEVVILGSDDTTSVTVNGGSFNAWIASI